MADWDGVGAASSEHACGRGRACARDGGCEQGQDRGLDRGHDYDHGHADVRIRSFGASSAKVELRNHGDAMVASVTVVLGPATRVEVSALAGAMERLAGGIEAAGGFVGHAKAFAEVGDAFVQVSVTDARERAFVRGSGELAVQEGACLQLAAIVFALDADALAELVFLSVSDLLEKNPASPF